MIGRDKDKGKKGGKSGVGKDPLSPDDRHLWDFVTRSVAPLMGRDRVPDVPGAPSRDQQDIRHPPHSGNTPSAADGRGVDFSAPLFGMKPTLPASAHQAAQEGPGRAGLDRRTAERLRRGQLPIEAVLDLHGMRQNEAKDELTRFLTLSQRAGRRCVLVITGKGTLPVISGQESGVLRRMLPHWLALAPLSHMVLDFTPARPKDGGAGAFYVLLRRVR